MIKRILVPLLGGVVAAASLAVPASAGAPVYTAPAAGVFAPPARLPWGAVPAAQPFKAASAVSAAQLAANRSIPKRAPGRAGFSTLSTTSNYFYAGGQLDPTPTGTTAVYSNVSVATPATGAAAHTLAETAAIQYTPVTNLRQIVEVGWTVDTVGVNGADHTLPHLFCYWWKNDKGQGWNTGSGFVPWSSPSASCGQSLSSVSGTQVKMGIVHSGTGASAAWWLAYGTGWVGYYPDTLWSSTANGVPPSNSPAVTFNTIPTYQLFGEAAFTSPVNASTVCTDMGNGRLGTETVAPLSTSFGTTRIDDAAGTAQVPVMTALGNPDPTYWNSNITASGATVRYGGPGAC